MFVGHLAVSLGARAVVPGTSLGVLIAASFGLDLLWPVLLLTGFGSRSSRSRQYGVHAADV